MPTFQQVKNICVAVHLNVNFHDLYDEFSTHKEAVRSIAESSKQRQSVEDNLDKWLEFLMGCEVVPPVLYRVVSYLILPGSKALPERIFSIMNAKWRDDQKSKGALHERSVNRLVS